MIEQFFASGHVADLVLAVMAIEAIVVFGLMRSGKLKLPFRTYLLGVMAGGCIVIAFRQALTGGPVLIIALALLFSFAAHMAELFSFVQRNNSNPNHGIPSYKSRSDNRT